MGSADTESPGRGRLRVALLGVVAGWPFSGCFRADFDLLGGSGALGDGGLTDPLGAGNGLGGEFASIGGYAGAEPTDAAGQGGVPSSAGTGGASAAGAIGFGGSLPSAGAGGNAGSPATGGAGDGGSASGGSAAGGDPGMGGSTAMGGTSGGTGQACSPSGTENVVSGFDSPGTGGLVVSGAGSPMLVWTGAVGNPDPGALQFDSSGGASVIRYNNPIGNSPISVMSLNVFVESGGNVSVRLFVETGPGSDRGEGAALMPMPGQWDCLTLDFANPAFADPAYDPGSVGAVGLDIDGTGPIRLYVDQVSY